MIPAAGAQGRCRGLPQPCRNHVQQPVDHLRLLTAAYPWTRAKWVFILSMPMPRADSLVAVVLAGGYLAVGHIESLQKYEKGR